MNFENHYLDFEVQEILREPYSGRVFPGYEDIDLSFEELETLVRNDRPDWKAALESVKGIYLLKGRNVLYCTPVKAGTLMLNPISPTSTII